jgi:23S rRNA (guanosine2251-2'-O)-methyltransferase
MKIKKKKSPQSKKTGRKSTKDVLYGAHSIIEMLKAKKRSLLSIYTKKPLPKAWYRIKPYLPKSVPNIQYVTKNVLDGIAESPEHMGVVALVAPFKLQKTMFHSSKKPFILLLDAIQDVRNLGAILRSAYCAGVDGVVLTQSKSAPLSAPVFKASAGLAEHLDIHIASSIKSAIIDIKKAGYSLYMAVTNGKDATKAIYKDPLCLVIGNEAVGITQEVIKAGEAITIPQRTPDISYNASVAAGILLFLISQKKISLL